MILVLKIRTREGVQFPLTVTDTTMIGRDIFPGFNRHISRRHGIIELRDGVFYYRDTSVNGTYHNGVTPRDLILKNVVKLRDGDHLYIEGHELVVSLASPVVDDDMTRVPNFPPSRQSRPPLAAPGGGQPFDSTAVLQPSPPAPLGGGANAPSAVDPSLVAANSAFTNTSTIAAGSPEPRDDGQSRIAAEGGDEWWLQYISPAANAASTTISSPLRREAAELLDSIGERFAPTESINKPVSKSAPDPELKMAFLEGLGMSSADTPAGFEFDEAFAKDLGLLMREITIGLMKSLYVRKKLKVEFDIDQTVMMKLGNNPLKFQDGLGRRQIDEALSRLIRNGKDPKYHGMTSSAKEVFEDVNRHQLALFLATEDAFLSLLSNFNPENLTRIFEKAQVKMSWSHYEMWFQRLAGNRGEAAEKLYRENLRKYYVKHLQSLQNKK